MAKVSPSTVEKTQILGFVPGADAFMSNSDDSLERQWKTSGWGPHTKTIHSAICSELKKGSNAQEDPWALFNLLIKKTNSYTKRRISLREMPFVFQQCEFIYFGRAFKAETLVICANWKEEQSRPTKSGLNPSGSCPIKSFIFLTFNEFLWCVVLKQSNLSHAYCWKNAQLFSLLSFVKLFSFFWCIFRVQCIKSNLSILLPYFPGKLLVNLFFCITSFL